MIDLTSNRISHVMSAEEFAAAKAELQKVSKQLDFMVKVTNAESDAFYRVGDADKTFMRNSLMEMSNASELLPPYLTTEELAKDLTCGDQLLELENALSDLLDNVRLNRRLANYEAYNGASVFYRLMGAAARSGSAQAKAIYDRLQSYHINKKKNGRAPATKAEQNDAPPEN